MRSYRSRAFHVAAALVCAACADETATGVAATSDLALVIPSDLRERLVLRTVSEIVSPGPARSEHLGEGTYFPFPYEEPTSDVASIWNEKTRVNFVPGELAVIGSHNYTGNKGRVITTGTVEYEGTVLGSQQASSENAFPFLMNPWQEHFIWAAPRIFTDRECGLSGYGFSSHFAWWEAVLGGPVFNFSQVGRSSSSDREFQPVCPPEPPPPPENTGFAAGGSSGGEAICYLWIKYDLYSGQILDQQLLYCTDGG